MKKIFTLLAAASVVVAANAGTRVLYSQDFESITDPAEAGWSYGGTSMKIDGDDYGQYLQLFNNTNGRNAQLKWDEGIYGENASMLEDGIYTLYFEFNPQQNGNNQYNCGITVLSNLTPPANQPFLARWTYLKDAEGNAIEDMSLYQGYLFDLTQVQRETEETGSIQFKINNDETNLVTMTSSNWYCINVQVNTITREVDYDITDLTGAEVANGSRTVPATECDGTDISMFATGLWVMTARYQVTFNFDKIMVTCESSADVANTPSCALTGVGVTLDDELSLSSRIYTITFMEGEDLVVEGTDGVTEEINYYTCDGSYKYHTTTSGTLTVYTKYGTAVSDKVSVEVDATPCALPEASAVIMSVVNGYGKTYRLEVDNKVVPLSPTIFISYKFVGDDGEIIEKNNEGTGTSFTVTQSGTITVTTEAYGYQATTSTIKNDIKYATKFQLDFARLSEDDIKAAGFSKIDDLNTANQSGENSWSGRKRLFYYDINTAAVDPESGETVYTPVYPFGYIADDDTEHVIHRWLIEADANTEEVAASTFNNIILWNGLAAQVLQGIGLTQNATTNNYNTVKVTNCGINDLVTFNYINNYGGNSVHPIVATDAEYFAQLEGENASYAVAKLDDTVLGRSNSGAYRIDNEDGTYTVGFQLYRIDTALVRATVFAAEEAGIDNVTVDEIKAVDNAWYTIDGIRMEAPTHSGLYIHNGKKVIIRK